MPYPKLNRPESPLAIKRRVGRPRIYVQSQLLRHLKDQGLSIREIAYVTGYSYGSVRRTLNGAASAVPQFAIARSARP